MVQISLVEEVFIKIHESAKRLKSGRKVLETPEVLWWNRPKMLPNPFGMTSTKI